MATLYDFQKQAIAELQHPEKHIVLSSVGSGKGSMSLWWLKSTGKKHWLIVTTASKRDSKDFYNEYVMWFGETPDKSLSSFTVISWEGLAKWTVANWLDIEKYAFVFDECLPYDTLVETEFGLRQLGTLAVGDKVWSYNEQTGLCELKTITRTIKRQADKKLYKIKAGKHEIISTANHPHYTQRGWVEARDIKLGDTLYVATEEARNFAQREEIRKVCGVPLLSQEVSHCRAYDQANSTNGGERQNILQHGLCQSQPETEAEYLAKDSQSYGQPHVSAKSPSHQSCIGVQTSVDRQARTQRWQRQIHPATDTFVSKAGGGLGTGARYQSGQTNTRIPHELQGRYRQPSAEDSDRSRWAEPQQQASENSRPEENAEVRGVRVESIEVLELRDIKRCGLYRDPNHVYCIDVEDNHNFFANGILTHNCQKSKAGTSTARGRAFLKITYRTDCWAGFTATPGDRWIDFQAYLIAGGYVKNKTQFMREFCQVQTFKGYPEIVGYFDEPLLKRWWDSMVVRPDTSKMEAELPAERHYTYKFKPDPYYRKLLKTHTNQQGEFLDTPGSFCAECRRLCFGKPKQQWLADYLEGLGTNAVLFYGLTATGDAICGIAQKALPEGAKVWRICGGKHEIPTAETIGKHDVVVCQWQAGAEALNLQFIQEWVSVEPCYSYSTSEQARGRIRRIGQQGKMRFMYLMCPHTIEESIYKALKEKSEFAESVWFEGLEEEL